MYKAFRTSQSNASLEFGRRAVLSRMVTRCSGQKVVTGQSSKSVAVVGAGAAGLVAIRELRKAGHHVTAFEQGSHVGGVWIYSDKIETDDLLGHGTERNKVHGSLYHSLRTNLPRHVMAYTDFPFELNLSGRDTRLFPGHEEVLRYLQQFSQAFDISKHIQFNTRLLEAVPLQDERSNGSANGHESVSHSSKWSKWQLQLQNLESGQRDEQVFDGLVICNGHYSEPRTPQVPGSDTFPGLQLHSHNFRQNDRFKGMRVVVMGASASGQDISRDIAAVADKVFFSARPMKFGSKQIEWETSDEPVGELVNMFKRTEISELGADSSVTFSDGVRETGINAVVYATGYHFSFPFLQNSGVVSVNENRVHPLHQHVFSIAHPSLSFIGLPWQVIPFPLMELQSKWVAAVLADQAKLPERDEMIQSLEQFYKQREEEGVPVRYTHRLGEDQWSYNAWLAGQVSKSEPPLPQWRPEMHQAGRQNIMQHPESYRDSFPNQDLVRLAESEAKQLRSNSAAIPAA